MFKLSRPYSKRACIENLLAELGWETLQERRTKHKLVIFFKIVNGLTPDYLSEIVPQLDGDSKPYSLRNPNYIQSIRAHTT